MKRKLISGLIAAALTAAPFAPGAAAQAAPPAGAVKARAAAAQSKGEKVVVKVRPGAKVLVGEREFPFEFRQGENLTGRVREAREKDFIFVEPGGRWGDVRAVIRYDDVKGVEHASGFKRALRNVGRYSLGAALLPVLFPLMEVMALLGQLPDC